MVNPPDREEWGSAPRREAKAALAAFALAAVVWAVRDLWAGPRVNTDGVRDLLAALSAAQGQGLPDRGPGVHGQHFGWLGPLYYLGLAAVLAVGRSVWALCLVLFAWHLAGTGALYALAREALGRRAWVAVVVALASSGATVALDLEHESFVMLPAALAGVCALRHERDGRARWLLGAFLAAGVAVQLQSLAALGVFTVAALRWRSRRVVSAALALGCVIAWTAPFLLTLVGPWSQRPDAPVTLPMWLLRQSLVPITSVVVFVAAYGQRAWRPGVRGTLLLASLQALALLAWPFAFGAGELHLGYFTYAVPVFTASERVDNAGPDREGAVLLLGAVLAAAAVARRRQGRDEIDRDLVWRGVLVGATPGVLLYLLHPSDRFLAHCFPWVALALSALLVDAFEALPARRRGLALGLVASVSLGDELLVWGSRARAENVANFSFLALESRSVRALAGRVGARPSAMLAVTHGLDPCGRTFGAWGLASRVEVALDAARGDPPRLDRHLRFGPARRCRFWDRFDAALTSYVPRLGYARAEVDGGRAIQLPIHNSECDALTTCPPPYHRHGRCGGRDRPVRVTLPHAGPREGDAIAVLVDHGEITPGWRFGPDAPNPLRVTLRQGGVPLTGVVAASGNPRVTTFALRPADREVTLEVTVSGGRVMTLDVWEP